MSKVLIETADRFHNYFSSLRNNSASDQSDGWIAHVLFATGSAIVIFGFMILTLGTGLFLVNLPLSKWVLLGGIISSLGFMLVYFVMSVDKLRLTSYLTAAGIFLGTMWASRAGAGQFIDVSYDGQAYHQEGIIQLAKGWNPLNTQLTNEATANLEKWLNHYTKGPWIPAAAVLLTTGDIEDGKMFNLMYMAAAFFLALSCLLSCSRIDRLASVVISLLLAVNPVSLYQATSFYIDGQLISLLICLIAISVRIFFSDNGYKLLPLFATLVLLVNTKLTAAIYAGLFLAIYFIFLWGSEKIMPTVKIFQTTAAALIIGFLLVGYNPYVTNTLRKGNPLYPAMGEGSLDYLTPNMPSNYLEQSRVGRLLSSVFAPSANIKEEDYRKIKMPFTYSHEELIAFTDTNAKEGGFGPLFSGIIILTVLAIYAGLLLDTVHKEKLTKMWMVSVSAIIVITLSVVINPLSSAARFVPQFWLVPISALIYALMSGYRVVRLVGAGLLVTLVYNQWLIGVSNLTYNYNKSVETREKFVQMSTTKDRAIFVDVKEFGSTKLKLNKYKIRWAEVNGESDQMECSRFVAHNISEVCHSREAIPASSSFPRSRMKPALSEYTAILK